MTAPRWEGEIWPRVGAEWVQDAYSSDGEGPLVAPADAGAIQIAIHVRVSAGALDAKALRVRAFFDGTSLEEPLSAQYGVAYHTLFFTFNATGRIEHRVLEACLTLGEETIGVARWSVVTTFGPPAEPWMPNGHLRRPWSRVLDFAARWCHGACSEEHVLARLQECVWGLAPSNTPRLKIVEAGSGMATTNTWHLLEFLDTLDAGQGNPLGWGCADASSFVMFFATILGVPCRSVVVARSDAGNFSSRPCTVVGASSAEVQKDLGYHEVVEHRGRIWDFLYRFSSAYVRAATRDTYLELLVDEPEAFCWTAPGFPSWEFSECVPLPQDASTPPPAPNVVAWAAALGVLPANLYIGYSGGVGGIIRSTHIRAYADDDLSLLLIDVYERESAPLVDALADGLSARWLGGVSLTSDLVGTEVEWAISPGPHPSAALLRVGTRLVLARSQGRPLPFLPATQLLGLLG